MEIQRKRPGWEWFVIVAVIVLPLFFLGATYNYQQKFERQRNLHYQLQVLRTALLLYVTVNKAYPDGLNKLTEGTFKLSGNELERRYIEHPPQLIKGKILDPFENAYSYDKGTGWIKSTTRGYEFW